MSQVTSKDGFRISFESFGHGVPVVLLHPHRATGQSWVELGWTSTLQLHNFRPICIDARGFGHSDPILLPDHLAPGTSTDDIIAVMDSLQVESAHICGFSLGAAMALRFAVDLSARVRSLVLGGLGIGPLVQVGLYIGISSEQARRDALTEVDKALEALPIGDQSYLTVVQTVLAATRLSRLVGSDMKMPILGVAGEKDRYNPFRLYNYLRATGADIKGEILPGVGHGDCFVDKRFMEAVTSFLTDSPAACKNA
jgi:pimeloyl-ACP methyl ester carboxylesterase